MHKIPKDLNNVLNSDHNIFRIWKSLTPISKNEWICWLISVKKTETRVKHLKRLCEDLQNGKKRPCCWPGCAHRKK